MTDSRSHLNAQIQQNVNERYIQTMTQRTMDATSLLAQLTHFTYSEANQILDRIVYLEQQGLRYEGIMQLLAAPAAKPEEVPDGKY